MAHRTLGWTPLLRAAIVTALLGHWIANALFDRDQYAGAGPDLLGRLDHPILVQVAMGLVALAVLAIRDRRREARSLVTGLGRLQLAAILVGIQLVLFVGMESTERLAIDALAGERADVGVFGAGFLAELLVAVGSALTLVVLGEATKRFLGSRPAEEVPAASPGAPVPPLGFRPSPRTLAGAGGVRAPPSWTAHRERPVHLGSAVAVGCAKPCTRAWISARELSEGGLIDRARHRGIPEDKGLVGIRPPTVRNMRAGMPPLWSMSLRLRRASNTRHGDVRPREPCQRSALRVPSRAPGAGPAPTRRSLVASGRPRGTCPATARLAP